ncbi:DUF6301 family protein [Actinoplanes sp. NPDC023801]|uniref:DUF6301 family protein n=1 Tax=Actinoplanes sp. NPDC023801 TaxID=3154595 RepID=UPI0033CE3F95
MRVLERTVAAVAGTGWGWTTGELEGLAAVAGWIYRPPLEGTVSCTFDAAPGRAGAFLFRDEVTAVYLILSERDGMAVLDRRDEFVAAIDQVAERLGPPASRCPGPDPSVGWRVAAGVLEIVDRPGALDLWLRPAPRRAPQPAATHDKGAPDKATPDKATPDNAGHDRAGHDRAGHDRAGHDRAGHDRAARDEAARVEHLATAAAVLPVGGVLRVFTGTETVVELRQVEDCLTVYAGGRTEILPWPATGWAYRKMVVGITAGR